MKRLSYMLIGLTLFPACQEALKEHSVPLSIPLVFTIDAPGTRALSAPDETRISDLNLLIYNDQGALDEQRYYTRGSLPQRLTLYSGTHYRIYACANLGYDLGSLDESELLQTRYHLAYPDEYSRGFPMSGMQEIYIDAEQTSLLQISLCRMMAALTLSMDRTALQADVSFEVEEVRIGGCPSSVRIFGESKAESELDLFRQGYRLSGNEALPLNREERLGHSQEVQLFLLENCQGKLLDYVASDRGKVFTDERQAVLCSYIELRARYRSPAFQTRPGEQLIYRFYLGEALNNFDVRRNRRYHITVRPEGNGLNEESWRVDTGALEPSPTRWELHPAAYNEAPSSEAFHLWCTLSPPDTSLEIEALAYEDDQVQELYTYRIDADGHGLTLYPRKGGTALIYFSAGAPILRDTLAMVIFDP